MNEAAGRRLQLALAGLWLLDAALQFQPSMFSRAFGQMLAESASGSPPILASAVTWNAGLVAQHSVALNALFATVQLLLGLGIAIRRTTRLALGASIAWALGVWVLGEGLGGVLTSTASPLTGAPGAALLYAVLAVLLWPVGQQREPRHDHPFIAAQAVGAPVARAAWLVLWLSLAYLALASGSRAPGALGSEIAGMGSGEPGWVAAIERGAASGFAGQDGLVGPVVLGVLLVAIAVGVYLPWPSAVKATLVLAVLVALVTWVVGEAFGMIMAGGATDPNSGPLLALLAVAYWPLRVAGRPVTRGRWHCASHMVHATAMLYMVAAVLVRAGGSGRMTGMGAAAGAAPALAYPTVAFVLAIACVAYCAWDLDQFPARQHGGVVVPAGTPAGTTTDARRVLLSPVVMVGCRVVMGVTMAIMLVSMI